MREHSLASGHFCGRCGQATEPGGVNAKAGSAPSSAEPGGVPSAPRAHESCQQLLALEPPRYCAQCGRRMKVQVSPLGWSAECSRHGRLAS